MAAVSVAVSVVRVSDCESSHYANLLLRCAQLRSLPQGKAVHARITKMGIDKSIFLENCLVNVYCKCRTLNYARNVFDKMCEHNSVSWNVIIGGYAEQGRAQEALELFQEMRWPNDFTFGSVVKACTTSAGVEEGRQVHCHIVKLGFEENVFVGSALVDMYSKWGSMEDAWRAFHTLSQPNVVSWNAMLGAYGRRGRDKEALQLFAHMLMARVKPSHVTFGFLLKACASVEQGKLLHAQLLKWGFGSHSFVGSNVILMYMNCGSVEDGRQVFDYVRGGDVGLFNAAMQGYSDSGQPEEAMTLFCQLLTTDIIPNPITLSTILKASHHLPRAKQLQAYIIKSDFKNDVSVVSSLVTMYARCGAIDDARQVFDKMPIQNVVLCTAMITGYTQKGYVEDALKLFIQMQHQNVKPNRFTYATVLSACASLASPEVGKQVHTHIIKMGVVSDNFIASGIVDVYVKCGCIENAQRVFDRVPKEDIVLWNVMIAGYVQNGYAEEALQAFEEMQQIGIKPNYHTFVAVLSACSHLGLVGLGQRYFDSLSRVHGIIPGMEHYCRMVDLLGRAGRLYEAKDFIKNMPLEPGPLVWETLFQACKSNSITF